MRTLVLLIAIVLVAGFAALNWAAFTTPAELSLGFMSFRAPPGALMLAILAVLCLAFFIYLAVWQATILMESRRHAKDLQAQRALADQAEASRIADLRATLLEELAALNARVTAGEAAIRKELHDSSNSLAAMLGEIDDRLRGPDERSGPVG